jgi:hypothetical protein
MGRKIKSEHASIERPIADLYAFLGDFTNFTPLMPELISNWEAKPDSCTFEIKGIITMGMRITERIPMQRIMMTGEGKIPFNFTLNCYLQPVSDFVSDVQMVIDADMNPFMAMMAEKPLTEFIQVLVTRLKSEMESKK